MPAAAVAGGVAVAGLAGQYFASQAQKEAAAKGADAQVQAQAMAIGAQRDAEERARQYYEPFRQLGLRAATPVSDSQYAQMTGREIIGRGGWRIDSNGTPYRHAATEQQNAMLRNTAAGNFSGGFGGGGGFGGRSQRPMANNSSQNNRFHVTGKGPTGNAMRTFANVGGQGGVFGRSQKGRSRTLVRDSSSRGGRATIGGGMIGGGITNRRTSNRGTFGGGGIRGAFGGGGIRGAFGGGGNRGASPRGRRVNFADNMNLRT